MRGKLIRQLVALLIVGLLVYLGGCESCKKKLGTETQQTETETDKKTNADTKTEVVKGGKQEVDCNKLFKVGKEKLNAVIFVNPHIGTIVGDIGTVTNTKNGGNDWTAPISATSNNLYAIAATDVNLRVAVGDAGTIMRSTDGGVTWTPIPVSTLKTLRAVTFQTSFIGFAAGDSGLVFKTINSGLSWDKVYNDGNHSFYGLSFNAAGTLFVVGNGGTILSMDTAGIPSITSISAKDFKSIHFALGSSFLNHTNTGFIVGDKGTIFKTTNGGINWSLELSITTENLRSVFLSNWHWGYAVGENATILRYNGVKWTVVPALITGTLNGVDSYLSETDVCVGPDGGEILCPPQVPNAIDINKVDAVLPTDCNGWDFNLVIRSLQDVDPSGGSLTYNLFRASSSKTISTPTTPVSGWGLNEGEHFGISRPLHELFPDPSVNSYTLTDYRMVTSLRRGESVYVTCCLIDNSSMGNPWLIGKYKCTQE